MLYIAMTYGVSLAVNAKENNFLGPISLYFRARGLFFLRFLRDRKKLEYFFLAIEKNIIF